MGNTHSKRYLCRGNVQEKQLVAIAVLVDAVEKQVDMMKKGGRPPKVYAMYKGEEMLATGTIKENAEKMGVTIATVRFQSTPAYRKRVKAGGVHREVFPIDDD